MAAFSMSALEPISFSLFFAVLVIGFFIRRKDYQPALLQGPMPQSWLLGCHAELVYAEAGAANRRWRDQFGSVYTFRTCFGVDWLMLNDPKAAQHVLRGQTTTYCFEESLREFLRLTTGKGVIYADGRDHARQRRLLQPVFNTTLMRNLTPKLASCAFRVAKQWHGMLDKKNVEFSTIEVNAYDWMETLTMESVGTTLLGVSFHAIEGQPHELVKAYHGFVDTAFARPNRLEIVLQAAALHLSPWLLSQADRLPFERIRTLQKCKETSRRFSQGLISQKRAASTKISDGSERDLLSVLMKAGEPDDKGKFVPISDEEIHTQLTSFFVAGYETTTNAATFALYEIARDSRIQSRLYAELADVLGSPFEKDLSDGFGFDLFEKMPYLVAVVKETLRLDSPVAHGTVQATRDDVIPLSKPLKTRMGEDILSLPVKKGQRVLLAYDGINRSTEIWGPDADSFVPERWLDKAIDNPVSQFGGPYADLATFGAGPKACIGWRLAVLELQAFIAVLVREFELTIADPEFELWKQSAAIVTLPMQNGRLERGPRVPLRVARRK